MGNDKLFQKRKIKAEESLMRKKAQHVKLKNILIVSEGMTEYNYFNDIRRSFRGKEINIILERPRGSAPINVVNCALEHYKKNEDIDYVFCVFDQDEHDSFNEALDKLKNKSNCKAIISIPCFEVWILLHFCGLVA